MSWLKSVVPPKIKRIVGRLKKNIPEGLWHKCSSCQSVLYRSDLEKNMEVCPAVFSIIEKLKINLK